MRSRFTSWSFTWEHYENELVEPEMWATTRTNIRMKFDGLYGEMWALAVKHMLGDPLFRTPVAGMVESVVQEPLLEAVDVRLERRSAS